ncbi:MAG: YbhN family protein, partial [Parachlamydiaceae bacterium]
PTLKLFSPMMAGVFLNVVLSIFVGEIARSYLVGYRFKVSKSAIFASVLVERIVDVAVLIFLLALVLAFSSFDLPNVNIGLFLSLTALAAIIFISLVIWKEPTIEWLHSNHPIKDRWILRIEHGIEGLRSITNPKLLFAIILISIIQWLVMAWANYKSITAIGIEVPFSAGILIMVVIAFALIMPQSPGHIGVIEFGYVFSLTAFGVEPSEAFAAAIVYHLIYLLTMGLSSIPALRLLSEKNHA